jgi:hypothetical protein
MEDMSGQISLNLSNQSEKIRSSTSKAKEVGQVVDTANKLIDRMLSRENRKKNIVKIVLVVIVMIVLSFKYCCY